ncbi:hypothetical protein JSE7799_02501 [Jannaschia seosinensis]|uniref:Uncharacterized protein n=1 Tax=Jannaschia seosinensis TaxID=313367 RepID=A0A0M7BCZ2_9RHOB|nr:hypothetical protein [Jannaschia seosinensis]CUH39773.1 hypothetical protein JSE7799_02501 [Jannaschia seosinensis]
MSAPLHIVRASPSRRAFAVGVQGILGLLLLWIALASPPADLGWRAFLVVAGVAALLLAWRGWERSGVALILDADGLRQEDGTWIAAMDDIDSVDRSLFTFKPSNGFLIRLRRPLGRAWAPGLWWRVNRRVGVGGVTNGRDTKILADALSFMVAERDAER